MSPDEIRERGLWPKGFLPLPHPFHATGGFVFPKDGIDAIKRQDGRDLTRFDIDFDLPERARIGSEVRGANGRVSGVGLIASQSEGGQ